MFSIMALKIGFEGDKISKKTVSASASPIFFSKFCHPRRRFWAKIENMISPDHVLY